jgi:hypothetical protein
MSHSQNPVGFENGFGKAAKGSLFPLNLRLLSQKPELWESSKCKTSVSEVPAI